MEIWKQTARENRGVLFAIAPNHPDFKLAMDAKTRTLLINPFVPENIRTLPFLSEFLTLAVHNNKVSASPLWD
jgi:hypothetical protein